MKLRIIGLMGALAVASPGLAQEAMAPMAKVACAQMDASLPPDLAAWASKTDVVSATNAAGLDKAMLVSGKAANGALHPTREVTYVTQPEKPGGSVSHGGLFGVRIEASATYRIILGSGAWIDVLKDGRPMMSSAHSPGPACTTARKMVDFPLEPGLYVIQISANADPVLPILVVRRP